MTLTQLKPQTVTFHASGNLILVRQPTEEVLGRNNATIAVSGTSIIYEFKDGRLIVDDALRQRDAQVFATLKERHPNVEFDERPAEEWLRENPHFQSRFWEIDPPAPDATALLVEIGRAEGLRDTGKLAEIYEFEQQNWDREPVIVAVTEALERLEG